MPPDGPEELKLAAAGVLADEDFLDEVVELLDEFLDTGAEILLAALGVGDVDHCQSPSALTHE